MSKNHIEKVDKLINCLRQTEGFQYLGDKTKEIIKKATLETFNMYKIIVEKKFEFNKITFQYNHEEGVLVRIYYTGDVENERREKYRYKSCKCFSCKNPCYKDKYTVEDFIDLINSGIFEFINFVS